MIGMTKLDSHATLVNRMSETVGADLGDALIEGRLSGEQLRGAVLRCCSCRHADACDSWLEKNRGGADAAPGYCLNEELFARLAP